MTTTPHEQLPVPQTLTPQEAKEAVLLLALERVRFGWTQFAEAVGGFDERVPRNDPRAERWCALGAIRASYVELQPLPRTALWNAEAELAEALLLQRGFWTRLASPEWASEPNPTDRIWLWNDRPRRRQEQVVAAFERALAELRR